MKRNVIGIVFATCALVVGSCSAQSNDLSPNDKDFIEYAGEMSLLASRLGHLAATRALHPSLRKFGEALSAYHSAQLEKLAAIANKTGGVAPNTLDDVHEEALSRVTKAKVMAFDHELLKAVVNNHETALVPFKREADHSQNHDLQVYAQQMLPKIEENLKEAKKLEAAKR